MRNQDCLQSYEDLKLAAVGGFAEKDEWIENVVARFLHFTPKGREDCIRTWMVANTDHRLKNEAPRRNPNRSPGSFTRRRMFWTKFLRRWNDFRSEDLALKKSPISCILVVRWLPSNAISTNST